ncbi:MAG: T9SS type A sorting domain-containing protein [Candidatus Paceibacterota bacterium]|jgi:hypothetical protein
MKKMIYFSVLLVSILHANAQTWEYYKDFPINVKPVDIDINNAGTIFMLSSDRRIFYKPLNQDWQEMPGFPVSNAECISVVKNSNRLYFGDFFQGLVYTDNYGQFWQQTTLTTNPITGWHEPVVELSNISNPNLFYGGSFTGFVPNIIKYTNNGLNGQIISFDPNNDPNNGVKELLLTNNNVLLIGTENGGIWKSSGNGTTFQQTNQNQHQFFRFTEGNGGMVYALGFNAVQNQVILLSSTDYMNWTSVALPNTSEKYTCIVFDSATQSLWLGSETGLYKSNPITNGPPVWNSSVLNNVTQSTVELASFDQNVYNFSNEFIAQKLINPGIEWAGITQGLKGVVNFAAFGSNNKIFSASYSANIVSSADDALAPWTNKIITGNAPLVQNLVTKPNGKVYLDMGLSLKKSTDNGLTYTDITPPNMISTFYRFVVGENNSLFVVKYSDQQKVYRSTDDGLTWSLFADFTSNIEFDPAIVESISEDSNGVIYVTTQSLDISYGINKLRYTTDQGATWNTLVLDVSQTIGSCSSFPYVFSLGNKTFFSACAKSFEVNLNSANPFQPYNFPWGESGSLNLGYFKINSQGHQYILDEVLYKSTDGGTNWTSLGRPSELSSVSDMNGVYIDMNDDVFIMTSDYVFLPTIYRGFYKVTETLGVENPESNIISIYPNPAAHVITIQITNPISSVAIYDMLGKNVLIDNGNTINISNLSRGVYIIKVTDENEKTYASKFIKD